MSLWADKYRPKEFSKLDYHKEQAADLKNLVQDGDFPHLLVYGPLGAGKKTRVMCLLREIYGPGVERLKADTMHFTTPSNKKLEIMTVSSNYHIELNPADVGIYDRVVVMEIIKNVAQSQQLDVNGQKEFKVIVLAEVDELTKDAQHALRRTMEKYVSTCRIILCATSISRVIPAIRSRCLCVRVPAPTVEEITQIITDICNEETGEGEQHITPEIAHLIAEKSERNLRRAILMCEAYKVENNGFRPTINLAGKALLEPDWQLFIKHTVKALLGIQHVDQITKLREALYELITNGIPSDIIFKVFVDGLLNNCDAQVSKAIISVAAEYEHRMALGNKEIFHLEAFALKCLEIYRNDLRELMLDEF